MPATTTSVNPSETTASPNPSRPAVLSAKWTGASSQPSRSAIAAWIRSSLDQSVVSWSKSRFTHSSSRALVTAASKAAPDSPRLSRAGVGAIEVGSAIVTSEG